MEVRKLYVCPIVVYQHSFVYTSEKITYTEANRFVADTVYPGEGEKARKRVRNQIRRAREKGIIPAEDPMDAGEFFRWARRIEGWEPLCEINGLPIAPLEVYKRGNMGCVVSVDGEPDWIPGNESERLELISNLQLENRRHRETETELARLREMEQRHKRKGKPWSKKKRD